MPTAHLHPLATLSPPCNTRTWQSTPHATQPLLATACADRTVRIYSLVDFTQHAVVAGAHKRSVRCCAWKPVAGASSSNSDAPGSGDVVLATGSFDASAAIWRHEGGSDDTAHGHNSGGRAAGEVDFTRGLAGGANGRGAGSDAEDDDDEAADDAWRLEVILDGHDSEIKGIAFSATAPLLATCSRDKSVWVWEELDGDSFETVAVLQDHEGDVKCVAWHPAEPLLASGSYDDRVRLWREDVDDWACCALLTGHGGTVWWVEFEGVERVGEIEGKAHGGLTPGQEALIEERRQAGSRLLTCSDDQTIRVWKRIPKDLPATSGVGGTRMPSIWKNRDFEEEWVEDARLPQLHDRPIYSLSWSRRSGRVVSAGSDGRIIVYEERWRKEDSKDVEMHGAADTAVGGSSTSSSLTEWVAVADVENAHDVFEINHVVWAPRADKGKARDGEEVIVSTGDDGEVKVWTLDD